MDREVTPNVRAIRSNEIKNCLQKKVKIYLEKKRKEKKSQKRCHSEAGNVAQAHSANVIIVDDEVAILDVMKALLEGWGYRVLVAGGIAQATSILQEKEVIPDCIIADYRLRGNHIGVEAIDSIREQYGKDILALIVPSDIAPERLKQVKTAGLEMLHKLVQPARLRSFLQNKLS